MPHSQRSSDNATPRCLGGGAYAARPAGQLAGLRRSRSGSFGRARKCSAASLAGLLTRGLGFGRVRGRTDMAREI